MLSKNKSVKAQGVSSRRTKAAGDPNSSRNAGLSAELEPGVRLQRPGGFKLRRSWNLLDASSSR